MTEAEQIKLGSQAALILDNSDFMDLYNHTIERFGEDILATSWTEAETREKLYQAYSGLRTFLEILNSLVITKDNILEMRENAHVEQLSSDM